ncbi:MAG TPA: glycoside hydrolase family 3 N-terminal domain-containing protein [Bryobacteraceae bacterium]|nr:glycoside hydrolase family 3 N-terminal domain-containing protein [Bryobacteraceae bacterium]
MTAARITLVAAAIAVAVFAAPQKRAARPSASPKASDALVRTWMRSLTLREKVAQLVVVPFYGKLTNSESDLYRKYYGLAHELKVGGMLLINRSEPYALAAFLNRMQRAATLPLLVAGDFERAISMRVESDTLFPHNMAFAATRNPEFSRFQGAVTARQGRALGVPWIFAPVADVNNNPDNPIINIRSYSENPEEVAEHVRAYIAGAHSFKDAAGNPVLVTVKHFPGHGDTATDSHMALPVITVGRERLNEVELVPFRAAIAAGVDAVMTAHIAVPAIDPDKLPSTLSAAVLGGLLKREMAFDGLVVTDALEMQGVAKQWPSGEAAVRALEAGADVLLMPPDPEAAVSAVVAAVQSGRITRERLDASVEKFLAAKVQVGVHRKRTVDIEALTDALDKPEDLARVQEIADASVTLVKNENDALPLRDAAQACFLVLTESRGSQAGRAFAAEVRKRAPSAALAVLDPQATEADLNAAAEKAKGCSVIAVAAFASVTAYRGSVALAGGYPKLMEALLASGRPVALIALGNPYLVRSFPSVSAYMTTYSTVAPSEIAAAKALFGDIPINGRLPVTIPGIAKYGDGIQLPKLDAKDAR